MQTGKREVKELVAGQYRHTSISLRIVHAALWERSLHSGVSISRMLDFAIRYYLPRLIASTVANPYIRSRRAWQNFAYWNTRAEQQFPKHPEIFITYSWQTERNDNHGLIFNQKTRYLTKKELFSTVGPENPTVHE
jgi:hypothetical protein